VTEHLYIHVPFCAAKCPYCAFYSRPGTEAQMAAFVPAVLRELQQHAVRPRTIFCGGGTPSLLPVTLWAELIAGLPRDEVAEWTIECNPATVDAQKAQLWRAGGVNRLSIGVQSFDDGLLRTLGRIHNAAEAERTFELARATGFDNINLDLMFALPGQTEAQWRATLDRAIGLRPEHISAYNLTLEEDTEFIRRYASRPAEEDVAFYELTIETLAAAGYRQYEISNFALPGRECQHNLAYWQGRDYVGLGPSAVSTVAGRRWQNVADTDRYLAGADIVASTEQLTPAIQQSERIAFGLRMRDGVPADLFRGWETTAARLLADGLLERADDRVRLTRRGLLLADEVAAEFVGP